MADQDDRAVEALRGLADAGDELVDPPAGLWARIEAEAFGEVTLPENGAAGADRSAVVDLDTRRPTRRFRPLWAAAAAAVVVIAGVGAFALAQDRDGAPAGQVVASTELEQLRGQGAGSAEVLDEDGSLRMDVTVEGLPETDGFYEVWLATADVSGLVSLGPVRADGTYDLPPGVDPGSYPIVDVSDEPLDGDPAHSRVSVLRGQLI